MKSNLTTSIEVYQIVNPQNDINNQILLAKSTDSFIREVTVNAYESPSCATEIVWSSTDPALVGLSGYNKVKLSCYNNGKGMTKSELDKATNFSSSIGKNAGLHGNKGKGEKLSGAAINTKGLVWVSCTQEPSTKLRKVHRSVMIGDPATGQWGKQRFLIENEFGISEESVVDITDIIDLKTLGLDIDKDWTLKIYCGVANNQNTVENPYGEAENQDGTGARISGSKRDRPGWLVQELSRRFPILPTGVKIKLANKHLTNDGKTEFQPVLSAIQEYASKGGIKYETVTVYLDKDPDGQPTEIIESMEETIPFFTPTNSVNVTYVYDPHCGKAGNENKSTVWYKSRMGITGVYSGLIHKNELYDFRGPQKEKGAPTWKSTAYELGIIDGYDQFRIFVSLPNADHIVNDENRTKIINQKSPRKEEFLLKNYRTGVQTGMPQWFKDLMEQFAPTAPTDKDLEEKYNDILKNMGQFQFARRNTIDSGESSNKSGQILNQRTHNNECPECAKTGTFTVIPRSVRKCPVCGWIKPPSTETDFGSGSLTPDENGRIRMVKKWPETRTFHHESEWAELNLADNFSKMVAQYLYNEGKLYINATYPSFKLLRDNLMAQVKVDQRHPNYEEILKHATIEAEKFIKDECLCAGLVGAIHKTTAPGFKGDDESWKRSVEPSVLSVYADHWMGSAMVNGSFTNPLYKRMKKWVADRFDGEGNMCIDFAEPTTNMRELNKKFLAVGGKLPQGELA